MRNTPRALLLGPLLAVACAHYQVPERSLDAYASLPRNERRIALVPAQRRDGATVYVHARDARPLAVMHGDQREVRVAPRARTTVGIVLMIESLGWIAGGLAELLIARTEGPCSNDVCGPGFDNFVGSMLISVGGVELTTGVALVATGAAHVELAPGDRHFVYLP